MELKKGHLSQIALDIDSAAVFLRDHGELTSKNKQLAKLIIDDKNCIQRGVFIDQVKNETIAVEKIIVLPSALFQREELPTKKWRSASARKVTRGLENPSLENLRYSNAENLRQQMGQRYLFLEKIGYFLFDASSAGLSWKEIPYHRSYEDDDAAEFLGGQFEDLRNASTVWLGESLAHVHVIQKIDLSRLRILEDGGEWFHIDPIYEIEGERVSMVDLILMHRRKKRKFFKLKDSWIQIPDSLKTDSWNIAAGKKSLKMNMLELMKLKAMTPHDNALETENYDLKNVQSRIVFDDKNIDLDVADALKETSLKLRDYQEQGVKWLYWLRKNRLHGLLADEMGLGKTHQSMALLELIRREKEGAPVLTLIVCPTSVIDHWFDKINSFAPVLAPLMYRGATRKIPKDQKTKTIITSYGIVLRDVEILAQMKFDAIILDEAHFVKNEDTASYQAVCSLKGDTRVALSGTPMENHLGELKAIYDFLLPGYFGTREEFRRTFTTPITMHKSLEAHLKLQRLLHPFKLRRIKEMVLKDLPEKVEDIRTCILSDEQLALYQDTVALKAQPLIDRLADENQNVSYLHVFAVLTLLKQICDHPFLAIGEEGRQQTSGKFELLKELVQEALESDQKVVIYSQFLGMIEMISAYFKSSGISHVTLTGATKDRKSVIDQFQKNTDVKVFVGSLLAGGIGIDLTAASVVIHYDRWWNASKENQATDRVHRIGQTRNVQVLKLVTKGTLEEKIHQLIESKRELTQKFLDRDEDLFASLTRKELVQLLGSSASNEK